jgi:t-SNARE complex subunit (syntaxin)
MADLNPDLQELHDTLISLISQLSDQIGAAPDAATVDAITTEIAEVNHRVTMVGNVLFAQQTGAIKTAVGKVSDATADVQNAIKQIASVTDLVKAMTAFLILVDKAIDLAKKFLP